MESCEGSSILILPDAESEGQMQRHLNEPGTANRVLQDPELLTGGCRNRVAGVRIEARVQRDVIVRCVETRMVENVKELGIVTKGESLGEFRLLVHPEIKAGLKRSSENVPPRRPESRLNVVADRGSVWRPGEGIDGLPASGNAIGAGSERGRNCKGIYIEHRLRCIHARRSLQLGRFGIESRGNWQDRIRNEVVCAVE